MKKIRKKRIKRLVLLGVIGFLLYLLLVGNKYSIYRQLALRRERARLINEIELLKKEGEALEEKVKLLTEDMDYIEKIAREKYKMAKRGERIYLMVPKKPVR